MKQKVYSTSDFNNLQEIVNSTKSQNIFLVCGKKSFFASGASIFIEDLVKNNSDITVFDDFNPNPQLEDLKNGVSLFKKGSFDLIIAIGGGSVLDMAKLISIFAHQSATFEDLVLGNEKFNDQSTTLLAIPTTAGTGAEATQFAVLYIDKTKYSVENINMLPGYVFLSGSFLKSAPSYLTACAGLDAFCQAVESIWSINATSESEKLGLKAAKLIWENLYKAIHTKENMAYENMQKAAFLAGKAIAITKTTAPHAISYAFTSYYGIPHGHAVALSLPYFLKFNYLLDETDCNDKRGALSVKKRIDALLSSLKLSIDDAPAEIERFFNSIEININIYEIVSDFNPDIVIENVNLQRLKNNPRLIAPEVIKEFLD